MGNQLAFEQIGSCLFVAKHPGVRSVQMEPAPISLVPPVFRFLGVLTPRVTVCFVEHPSIQAAEDFFGNRRAQVVGPASDDRIEPSYDCLGIDSLYLLPKPFEFHLHVLDGCTARV